MGFSARHISEVLTELMVRYGYSRFQWRRSLEAAWAEAAGPQVAEAVRIGRLRRGVLEIIVPSSTLLQELSFQKSELLQRLASLLPDQPIRDLRFRVGHIK